MERIAHFGQDIDTFVAGNLGSFLEIEPGAEHTTIGGGQDDDADTIVSLDLFPGIRQPVRCRY